MASSTRTMPSSLGLPVSLVLALLALPIPAHAQEPPRDSVSAVGHVLQTDFFGSAEAGPNGESPVGSLTLSGFLDFTTATTCLNVSGNSVVSGGRILTGRQAGQGFLSSSVDRGPPVNGNPVDVTVYSGLLPTPPRNCPSPADPPPAKLRHTGGGPFTSGDLTVVDAIERLPGGAPAARVRLLPEPRQRPGLIQSRSGPGVRVRVCGAPGIALIRVSQRTSPADRNAPVWLRGSWRDERRQTERCQVHRLVSPLGSALTGRHLFRVRARTTGRDWSATATRTVDLS
jgi:hypothetical protein